MKTKTVLLFGALLLVGCEPTEKVEEWYVGTEKATVTEVVYYYNEAIIPSSAVTCTYYVETEGGKQDKFVESGLRSNQTCLYEKGEDIFVEVYENSLGAQWYGLVGIRR